MNSVAMKSHFPQFAPYFDAASSKEAIKKMKNGKKVELYQAIVAQSALQSHSEVTQFKQKLIKVLTKKEKKQKLSKEQKELFHQTAKRDVQNHLPQPASPSAPSAKESIKEPSFEDQAKLKREQQELQERLAREIKEKEEREIREQKEREIREQKEKEARELNESVEMLALCLEAPVTQFPLVDENRARPDKEQFSIIALDHLQEVKNVLTFGTKPFFTSDEISEMSGASYPAMLDCALIKLLQTARADDAHLHFLGNHLALDLSALNTFDNFLPQLAPIRNQLLALQKTEKQALLKKITNRSNEKEGNQAVIKLFRDIGAFRTPFEHNLMLAPNRRFLSIFTSENRP